MRHKLTHFSVTENLPLCPECDAPLEFAHAADRDRDGRLYLIFHCTACQAGEAKIWRPDWQALADELIGDEDY